MAVQQATFLAGECDKEDEEAAGAGTSDADMYMQDDEESGGASPSTCRRVEWVEPPGGCVYCHLDDAGAGPLGGLCHVQANAVPAFAARVYPDRMARLASAMANERGDSSSPWTSEENMAGAEGSSDHFIAHGPMVSKV